MGQRRRLLSLVAQLPLARLPARFRALFRVRPLAWLTSRSGLRKRRRKRLCRAPLRRQAQLRAHPLTGAAKSEETGEIAISVDAVDAAAEGIREPEAAVLQAATAACRIRSTILRRRKARRVLRPAKSRRRPSRRPCTAPPWSVMPAPPQIFWC